MVIRVEDLITWITFDTEWNWGRLAKFTDEENITEKDNDSQEKSCSQLNSSVDFSDIEKEMKNLGK